MPELAQTQPTRPQTRVRIDDRLAMGIGIPAFGLLIPNLTGLFGPLGPGDRYYYVGYLWFIGLAAIIWYGNRALLFAQRAHWDWFQHPVRKLSFMLAANVFYTAPVTVAWIWLWYRMSSLPFDVSVVRIVALANTICVVFVTHGYETAYLIQERSDDHLVAERLRRAKVEAELTALRAQLDPHFMFNALNTLAQLVAEQPRRAEEFVQSLAEVYRYVLAHRDRDLVMLSEELEFIEKYAFLLRLRFGSAFKLEVEDPDDRATCMLVPPLALQVLVENVVKHNALDQQSPLIVTVTVESDEVVVSNPVRLKQASGSEGVGLANLTERCKLATGRVPAISRSAERFDVRLPMLELTA